MNKHEKHFIKLCQTFQATDAFVEKLDEAWNMCTYLQSSDGHNKPMDDRVVSAFCELLRSESVLGYRKSEPVFFILTCGFEDELLPPQIKTFRECLYDLFLKIHSFDESSSHLTVLWFLLDAYDCDESIKMLEYFLGVAENNALIIIPWGLSYLYRKTTSEEIKTKCLELLRNAKQSKDSGLAMEAELYLRNLGEPEKPGNPGAVEKAF